MPHQIFRHPTRQRQYNHLTPEQIASWMQYGFIRVPGAFSREQAESYTSDLWERLGYDPHDMSTWTKEMNFMDGTGRRGSSVPDFAPKAWQAICELCGGEDRIKAEDCHWWDDGFIVNLGTPETEGVASDVNNVDGWHVDGDWFTHYLDSPEQALLLIPCWSDVIQGGGPTVICADGIGKVARWLYDHPQGVNDNLVPLNQLPGAEERWFCNEWAQQSSTFFEMTADIGDVLILHPLMIHSASKNGLRVPRVIANPLITLKEPFNFDRNDPFQYSLIELKTLKELGRDRLHGWRITGQRRQFQADRG